jgi:transcriptional regulator with XRE-family HTH domain
LNLGRAVREIRKDRKQNQETFAKGIGITQTSLSLIENGTRRMYQGTIDKLCKYLGCTEIFLRVLSMDDEDLPENKRDEYRVVMVHIRGILLEIFKP